VRDADPRPRQWVRGLDRLRRWRRCLAALGGASRLVRRDWARLYLSPDRSSGTLSGRRGRSAPKMIRATSAPSLTDVTLCLHEPPRDFAPRKPAGETTCCCAAGQGQHSARRGHKPIAIADHVVDLSGPGTRRYGGRAARAPSRGCWPGGTSPAAISTARRPPSRENGCGRRPPARADPARRDGAWLSRRRRRRIPLGVLCVVTGVAGSGWEIKLSCTGRCHICLEPAMRRGQWCPRSARAPMGNRDGTA